MTAKTWNGTSADWTTAADWTPSGQPGADDSVAVDAGAVSVTSNVGEVAAANLGDAALDVGTGAQPGDLVVTGALANGGQLDIGAGGPSTGASTVTVGSLANFSNSRFGAIDIEGGASGEATLDVAANAGFGVGGAVEGIVNLNGDALVEFASGQITSIASGGALGLVGNRAFIADADDLTSNSALTALTTVTGALNLQYGAALATGTSLTITGEVGVDPQYGQGGSSLVVAGAIDNGGQLNIGAGASLSATATVTATALNNYVNASLGTIDIEGGASTLAELNITSGAAGFGKAGTLYGTVTLSGDALLAFASGSLTTIAANASLSLTGADAFVADAGHLDDNSALTGLATISGGLYLDGGAAIATSTGLSNSGILEIGGAAGQDDSILSIGGAIVNTGYVYVGDGVYVTGNSEIASSGVNNSGGTIDLSGQGGLPVGERAEWDVTQGVAGFGVADELLGQVDLSDDALFEFASGQIETIASGAELTLSGANARIADASDTGGSSALLGLATISGALYLTKGALLTTSGALTVAALFVTEGALLTTGGALTVTGVLYVDYSDLGGGAIVSVGGAIDNDGIIRIGDGDKLTEIATVDAVSLSRNSGQIYLDGNDDAPTPLNAMLDLSGPAGIGGAGVLQGTVDLSGGALIEFGSGQINAISGRLTLDGDDVFIADAGDTDANSALAGLTSVSGDLILQDGARIVTSGGLTNNGEIYFDDDISLIDGSSLTVDDAFVNNGTFSMSSAATTTFIAASFTNSEAVWVDAGATLTLTGNLFTQTGGYTEIAGTLAAGVSLGGGTFIIDAGATVTGAIAFSGSANLYLAAAQSAANVLSGLAYGDTITMRGIAYADDETMTLLSTSNGVQTFALENADGTVLTTLAIAGDYASDYFAVVDNNGAAQLLADVAQPPPPLTGMEAGQQITDQQSIHPFADVTFTNEWGDDAPLSVSVQMSNPANGTLSGFSNEISPDDEIAGDGVQVTQDLRAIVFTPTAEAGATETTAFTISIVEFTEYLARGITDSTTTVTVSSYSGGGQTLAIGGAPGYGVSVYDTSGDWDLIGGSNGTVYLTDAQTSVVGGGDTIHLLGASGDQASLYETDDNWDALDGSNATIYLTNSQAAVYGGADTVELLGSAGDAVSLYNSSGSWDVVAGDGGTIYLTDAQASVFGGGDIVNLQGTTGNQVSLYNTANVWDTVQAIDGGLATIFLTDAQASVLGGGESVYLLGTSGNQISLYNTAGDWDGVTGSDASISLTSAQASVTGGGDTFYLLGGAGDALSLYGTNNNWDLVSGSSATIYLTSAQTSVSGSLDAIDFAGGADDAVSLYNTNGSWDTIEGSHGTVYLTSSQTSVIGGGNTINFSGGTGNIVSLAQTAGLADTVLGSNGTADLYGAQLIVNGSSDTLNMNNNSTVTLKGASTLIAFDQGIGGQDVINGFASSDKIQLSKSDFANFSALSSHLSQVNSSTVIRLNASDTIELAFVTVASLTAAQFLFV